jgi:NADH/F420H2 dehydrogenase subunit C
MSAENNPQSPSPSTDSAATTTPAAEPQVTPLGLVGQQLAAFGYVPEALGNDAGAVEMLRLSPDTALDAAEALRDKLGFDLLVSVTGVDWKTHRESVYHLYSTLSYQSLVVKVQARADETSPSMMPVWPAADWHERESYDLMGIVYEGHPNLTRILMPNEWLGHPLRKDYQENDPRLVWNRR